MIENQFSWTKFYAMPIIGIMRNIPENYTEPVLSAFYNAGFTRVELTMNSAGFEDGLKTTLALFKGKLNIGAGTVCNMQDYEKAVSIGAQFIVTPILDENIISACRENKIPVFPGAYTPTEIYKAWKTGADMVKVFPATAGALDYIKAVKGPFPDIKLLPTGGIHLENCIDFLKAGASGLGVGSGLFNPSLIQKSQDELQEHFSAFSERVKKYLF